MATSRVLRSAPYFVVADVDATAAYYAERLGFTTEYIAGTPAEFAMCTRDGFAVMLRRVSDPAGVRPIESQGGTWDAFFWVDRARGLYEEFAARGVSFAYDLVTQQQYGMLEFAVRDEDGHVLGFGEQIVRPVSGEST